MKLLGTACREALENSYASNDAKIARIRSGKLETDEELKVRVVKG